MGKKTVKKEKGVLPPKSRDVLILTALILVLLVMVFANDKGYLGGAISGTFVQDVQPMLQNEIWDIAECTQKTAQDAAEELHFNYFCGENYCYEAAYGVTLPGNNLVQLDCLNAAQRNKWVEWCNGAFNKLC
jgi:hypothetical protein